MELVANTTDNQLLARLEAAPKKQLTREEIEKQRLSFVYSIMGGRPGMTREKVQRLIEQQAGT